MAVRSIKADLGRQATRSWTGTAKADHPALRPFQGWVILGMRSGKIQPALALEAASDHHQLCGPLPTLGTEARPPMTTAETPVTQSPASTEAMSTAEASDPRALTLENVERALDELRPYLMADGGNVEVVEIDGPIVKVRLQGACGSCPSSTMTLKMGIERKLREAIPEVSEVVQVL